MTEDQQPNRLARRTIAKGAAWSVPVAAAMSVPVPAYAASGAAPRVTLGAFCKLPGNSCGQLFVQGYIFEVTVTNASGETIYLYNEPGYEIEVTDNNPNVDLFFEAAIDQDGNLLTSPYMMAPGASVIFVFNAGDGDNSANLQDVEVCLVLPWGHTPNPADDLDDHPPVEECATSPSTPPEQGAQCQLEIDLIC